MHLQLNHQKCGQFCHFVQNLSDNASHPYLLNRTGSIFVGNFLWIHLLIPSHSGWLVQLLWGQRGGGPTFPTEGKCTACRLSRKILFSIYYIQPKNAVLVNEAKLEQIRKTNGAANSSCVLLVNPGFRILSTQVRYTVFFKGHLIVQTVNYRHD